MQLHIAIITEDQRRSVFPVAFLMPVTEHVKKYTIDFCQIMLYF